MEQRLVFSRINYQIHPERNLFTVEAGKKISFEDLIVHVGNLMLEPQFVVGMSGLYDFRELTELTGDVAVLHATAEAMNDHTIINKAAKTAIISNDAKLLDIFNAYQLMTRNSLIDYRVFHGDEYQNALDFLSLSADDVNELVKK